ncbi:sigma-70 family RNA polymerase sigma factor [Plantactinospora sp. B6F1]|uniref:sigma-70 family RNA polymerase sigma factor n=1 Tax=Plantactinospora sp. B6F1 TaxID=3158971 RepID=UPI0032D98881
MTIAPVRGRVAVGASAPAAARRPKMPTQRSRAGKPAAPRVDFDALVREQRIEMLVRDHRRHAVYTLVRLCGSWADAEDAVQDAILHLLSDPTMLDGHGSPVGWLVATAKWKLVAARAARARQCPALLGEHIERVEDRQTEPTGGPCMADPEVADRVRRALSTLSPEVRRAVELHCVQGLSIEQVMEATGKSRHAVHQLLYTAMKVHKNWNGPEWREKYVSDPEAEALRTQVRLLAKLPPRTREVVWLRYVDELPLATVAARTGLTQKMVSQHLNRARVVARVELAERTA